jgi:hypothetical protein
MRFRIAVLLAVASPLLCEDLKLAWAEMPEMTGRKVEVQLKSGTILRGKAVAVRPEGLRMEIARISGAAARYDKGEFVVPAGEITVVKVNRNRVLGRAIGTAVTGTFSGMIVGFAGADDLSGAGKAIVIALPVAGYAIGWLLDRHTLTIHVLP